VLVSDLDVQCALWLKLRLAPMCPWVGTISLAFVGPPAVKVQLSPYNRVRLMRIPVLQVCAALGVCGAVLCCAVLCAFSVSLSLCLSLANICTLAPPHTLHRTCSTGC
jgi:hypothetical protein